jgi:hypothetical protein
VTERVNTFSIRRRADSATFTSFSWIRALVVVPTRSWSRARSI